VVLRGKGALERAYWVTQEWLRYAATATGWMCPSCVNSVY
jgi:hypothetical protein